jgi:TPR repeat protein
LSRAHCEASGISRVRRVPAPSAQFRVGHATSGAGVPHSTVEAVRWLERAAEAVSLDGQYYLALLYLEGVGVGPFGKEARQ